MALSDMKVYNDEIVGVAIELLGQDIEKFNAASGGTIVLSTEGFRGDFSKESFFNQIAAAQRRVNRYAANGAVTPTDLTQGELAGVKVAGGFGPIRFEPSQLTWLQRNPDEAIVAIAQGFANALLADQLNTAVLAGVAAIENQAALTNDVSGTGAITHGVLNKANSAFGDMSGQLTASVMRGQTAHRLIGQSLDNSNRLFEAGNVLVTEILGQRHIVSDIPALYEAGTPNKEKVLTLTAGGIIVDNTSDIDSAMEKKTGNQRIETLWQADYTFGLKLKGYAWDIANGGKSPDDTALATGTNWDKAVAENKHTAGVLSVGSADVAF